jgi:hypothetical protein
MELIVTAEGAVRCIYDEAIPLSAIGHLTIRRASHVEADPNGQWLADLSPVRGPQLGPFESRRLALSAEWMWLENHWLAHRP